MITTILAILGVVALMVGGTALYVAGEFAVVGARRGRIQQMAEAGDRMAQQLLPVLENRRRFDNYIAASQVGITLASIIGGLYGQTQIAPLIAPYIAQLPLEQIPMLAAEGASDGAALGIAAILVLLVLTTLQVVLGELVPKSIAIQYPERTALATVMLMRWSADIVFRPLIIILNGSGNLFLRLLGLGHAGEHTHIHSPEEIEILVTESQQGGVLDEGERELVHNAFRLGERTAAEVMIPRTRISAIPASVSLQQAIHLAADSAYTRLLVYENNLDTVVGYVHLRDLYRLWHETPDAPLPIIGNIPQVPETTEAGEVWQQLNDKQKYIAVVFDEYGGTAGMITQEDLIEELFGDVEDEFDPQGNQPTALQGGSSTIHGDLQISTLNDLLDVNLPTENANTVGGLIQNNLRRVPRVGDTVTMRGVALRVDKVQRNAVQEVSVTLVNAVPSVSVPSAEKDEG